MSSLKIVELTESNTCKICDNAVSKYSCPRCNIMYCSLACYQSEKHSECSELFYKDCVMNTLNGEENEETKAKMMEILQRTHEQHKLENGSSDESCEEDSDDDDEYETIEEDSDDYLQEIFEGLEERLAHINLDDSEEVWDHLNDAEKEEFEAFLMSGDVSKYIPVWTPWWEYNCDKKIIEVTELDEQKEKCPKITENVVAFKELCGKTPADCMEHNMMNIIAAYAFTLRYFNGDHFEFSKESASYIYNLSLNLKKNQNFDSFNQAVSSVTMECTNSELSITADEENMKHVKTDVHMILSGPHATERKYYLLAALSDMSELFKEASKPKESVQEGNFYKKFTENQVAAVVSPADIKKSLKKLEYFLSYAKYYYGV